MTETLDAIEEAIARHMEQDIGPKTYQGLALDVLSATRPIIERATLLRAHAVCKCDDCAAAIEELSITLPETER